MDLQYFPMDRQLCNIEIESCELNVASFFQKLSCSFFDDLNAFWLVLNNISSSCVRTS